MIFGPKIRIGLMLKHCVCLNYKALISGFNDKKAIDDLYESGMYKDETDHSIAQGPEEVGIYLHSVI